jgi:hypothetical protein
MKIVITADVINSRRVKSDKWLDLLKRELGKFGEEYSDWEVYRGDSFQLLLEAADALRAVFHIKTVIKQISPLNVRMALGLGGVNYRSDKVLESNGSAFIHSGECFDNLKKQNLMIKSDNEELDTRLNLMFGLAGLAMDYWKPVTAEIIHQKLEHPNLTQRELTELMGKKSQSTISEGLKRGGYDEIESLIYYFEAQMKRL